MTIFLWAHNHIRYFGKLTGRRLTTASMHKGIQKLHINRGQTFFDYSLISGIELLEAIAGMLILT